MQSSDDPLDGYDVPEMEKYRQHLAPMFPKFSAIQAERAKKYASGFVDLDEDDDMDGDDDFNATATAIDPVEARGEEEEDGSSDDEASSISRKPPDEQAQIRGEIQELTDFVPQLSGEYRIIDRLGTGTFSSVYKAVDLHYNSFDNAPWHGHHPSSSSAYYQTKPHAPGGRVFVAIKRIYVTSNPERIRNEIAIMEDCRGCRHVGQLITAFRHRDQVVAIMPYHKNEDFRDYYRILPMGCIKAYFRCMFRALRDTHARGVIHRDVKPANFLFDPITGIGTLCDFGLACRMAGPTMRLGACLHDSPCPEYPHGRLKKLSPNEVERVKIAQKDARQKSTWPTDRVGYLDEAQSNKPHSKANRAGTRGFRAPEVLLKCADQSGAVDMWAAGMILLFFLCKKFPLFQSNDDVEALMEIAAILGKRRMEKTATLHSRMFSTNVPSVTQDGIRWRDFVTRQNPKIMKTSEPDARFFPYNQPSGSHYSRSHPPTSSSPSSGFTIGSDSRSPSPIADAKADHEADVHAALDLTEKLLEPDCTKRLTPREALYHQFLVERDGPGDDAFVPHPYGSGVCKQLHFKDEVTEEPCVRIPVSTDGRRTWGSVVKRLAAGEGIAIGETPCEFHQDLEAVDALVSQLQQ